MTHMHSAERPICELAPSIEMIGSMTRTIYGDVDCEDCLRRTLAEGEARTSVLRELLAKVETVS